MKISIIVTITIIIIITIIILLSLLNFKTVKPVCVRKLHCMH